MAEPTRANLDAPREMQKVTNAGLAASAHDRSTAGAGEVSEPGSDGSPGFDRLIDGLRTAVWRRESLLDEARACERALEAELASLRSSLSWRATAPLRSWGARHARAAKVLRRGAKVAFWTATLQLPSRLRARRSGLDAVSRIEAAERERTYEKWIEAYDTLTSVDRDGMQATIQALEHRPLVSILMPVFDPPERFLREAIESVRGQVYEKWELCVADDSSCEDHVRRVLTEYTELDSRIRVTYRAEHGGISAASNDALSLARGELVGLLDHDDVLRPHGLLLAVLAFAAKPSAEYVYSDEDKIDENGDRFAYWFKPDWNPALLRCQNYLCHFSVFRADLARRAGGFRSEYDGSQDWDLFLRMTELLEPDGIAHVPHVLYHWRAIPGSAAAERGAKPYSIDAGRRATQDHLRRVGRPGYVVPAGRGTQKVRYLSPSPLPLVSVIVPTTGEPDLLEPCLESLLHRTEYDRFEVIVSVSEAAYGDSEKESCLRRFQEDSRVRVVTQPQGSFNFARTVNEAAAYTDAEYVLLLNDDTEVVNGDWLEAMVGHVEHDDVGAVGALLLYPDETIQSAGMLVGARGMADHLYEGRPLGISGYMARALLPQDVSVVTGTCMLVKRRAYAEVGGFDESFPVCYNDVDFCLKLRRNGWRVLFVPDATFHHLETASFGTHQRGREEEHRRDVQEMRDRWGSVLLDDPLHNPNLALDASDPSRLAFPPRVEYPWRPQRTQPSAKRVGASSSSSDPANR